MQGYAAVDVKLKLFDKRAHLLLTEQDAAYLFAVNHETGDHSDPGLQGLLRVQSHIHPFDFQIRKFFVQFSQRPAGQMAAGSEDGMEEGTCFHGEP